MAQDRDKDKNTLRAPAAPKAPSPNSLARSRDHKGQSGPEVEELINLPTGEEATAKAGFIAEEASMAEGLAVASVAQGSATVRRYGVRHDEEESAARNIPLLLLPSAEETRRRRLAEAAQRRELEARAQSLLERAGEVRNEVSSKLTEMTSRFSNPSPLAQRQIANLRKELTLLDGIKSAIRSGTPEGSAFFDEIEDVFEDAETMVEEVPVEDRGLILGTLDRVWGRSERGAWKRDRVWVEPKVMEAE